MDYSMGGIGGSGDEDTLNSQQGKRSTYKRLNSAQTSTLEKVIKECAHPDEAHRRQLAEELGLEPKQIKFWFQNKRTQIKNQHERADNNALRVENDRIHNENLLIREALSNTLCPSCGGPPFPEAEHELFMQKMRLENEQLKEEHEKVSNLLARYLEKQMSQPELQEALALMPKAAGSSRDSGLGISQNQEVDGSPRHDHDLTHGTPAMGDGVVMHNNPMENLDIEKALMSEIATTAMEEFVRLVRINEPFWVSSSTQEGKFTLHRESYDQIFPKTNHFKGANARVESSKYTGIVKIGGMQLVDMFLDSDKWANLFPTIVTKAETTKVLENGSMGNRSGALQLMYEEMHILSPLVRPREYHFLRYCQQVDVGVWVITDVSYDSSRQNTTPALSRSLRHPSGCMIREMHNGSCTVTWVEHVEVDDKIHTHRLYRDVIGSDSAYGAEGWITGLQRMGERSASFYVQKIPNHDSGGVITSLEGRRSVMRLAHRMTKMFCESLNMSGQVDLPDSAVENNSGVRVSVRKTSGIGQPSGMVVGAATSFWLPVPCQKVFEFLTDPQRRPQWDVLSCGNPVIEAAHISNGIHSGNFTSIIQPFIPMENNAMILQESFTSPVGSYVIYAPTDVSALNVAIRGDDSSTIPILPSGFVVSPDGQPSSSAFGAFNSADVDGSSGGTLLTVAFQILACSTDGIKLLNMESVAAVNTLLTSTIQKVKEALNCNSLE